MSGLEDRLASRLPPPLIPWPPLAIPIKLPMENSSWGRDVTVSVTSMSFMEGFNSPLTYSSLSDFLPAHLRPPALSTITKMLASVRVDSLTAVSRRIFTNEFSIRVI